VNALTPALSGPYLRHSTDRACAHCGLPARESRFCCAGCRVAHETIHNLGFGKYYAQRQLNPAARGPRPEVVERHDLERYVIQAQDGTCELTLAVDGLQCGACIWLIEGILGRDLAVTKARVNLTSRRLRLVWQGAPTDAARLTGLIETLGYRLIPFDAEALEAGRDHTGRALLRALAVAGFAAGNVMLISIGVWAGLVQGMGPGTRGLMHFVSALIALPAIAYAGRPFFASAFAALRLRRTNMDVPISVGVILVTGMSVQQSFAGGTHTYFDSAVTLLFFLLIGRYLDHLARGRARAVAEQLLTLGVRDVAVLLADGSTRRQAQESVAPGEHVLVGPGERIGTDGVIERGATLLDASLITGESLPVAAGPGSAVFAGTLNLGTALVIRVTATGASTLLAECVRLIEAAETRRGRYVVLADRVARRYAPAVHLCALLTFLGWLLIGHATIGAALLIASAVLIITCPCALALAVPAVQVIATSRLLRSGVMLKSGTALERLAEIDVVVFDKTGTLTKPDLALILTPATDLEALHVAAALAASSRHPLARALLAAAGPVPAAKGAREHPGQGLSLITPDGEIRLGSRAFCGCAGAIVSGPELWLARPCSPPVRFEFAEALRADAAASVAALRALGLEVRLLSGDRAEAVAPMAALANIICWRGDCLPAAKVEAIEALRAAGKRVLMVGDGLNDGPCLAAADVSAAPASAADVSQTVADVVFQGDRLAPLVESIRMARRSRSAMRQNLAMSIGYNLLLVPLAMAGFVTPWLAAAAMSTSSLIVMLNSLRLRGRT
jgi:Cu2+-exporting ATPase